MNLKQNFLYHEKGSIKTEFTDSEIKERLKKYCPNETRFFNKKGLHLKLNPNLTEMQIYVDGFFSDIFYIFAKASPIKCILNIQKSTLTYNIKRNKYLFGLTSLFLIFILSLTYMQTLGIISIAEGGEKPTTLICIVATIIFGLFTYCDSEKTQSDIVYFKLAIEYATKTDVFKQKNNFSSIKKS